MKVCPVCATEYPDDVRFCPNDGQTLRATGSANELVDQVVADRYHILRKLGEGGMGQVYLAEHVKMGRRCAIKVMNPSLVHDPEAVSRFNREAANASRITHPNVCAVYDFGETPDGLIYLAMELVEGEPLTALLAREKTLPARRAAAITRQVADALQVAHDLGIVHRDLKPDNIMLARGRDGADVVKVVDFGIAKAMAGGDSQKVTRTGLVVGTPEFMSPEQLAADQLDGRSDIYSLALVLYRMVSGRLPFEASTVQETMVKRLTDAPTPLAAARPDLTFPAGLQAVLDTALARRPAERYQSAAKFGNDVAAIAGLTSGAGTAVLPPTRADGDAKTALLTTPAPRRRSLVPVVLGAVVVVAAGGGYALFGRTRTPDTASRDTTTPAAVPPDTASRAAPSAPASATARLNDWFDRIDDIPGAALRDSARAVFDTPGLGATDRALAAYLVANAYAKLEQRAAGCEWARRAAGLDAGVRSYQVLARSLCGS
jgi:serine/threonine-protein kinase